MSRSLVVRVLEEVDLPRTQHAVLLAMASYADDDGKQCWPSVDRIAWTSGYKPRAVVVAMAQLREKGVIIEVTPAAGRRPAEYEIQLGNAPQKPTFDQWKDLHSRRCRGARGASHKSIRGAHAAPLQRPQGCIPRHLGVHHTTSRGASDARRGAPGAPEPITQSKEPVKDSSAKPMPRHRAAQTLLATLYEDVLHIGPPTNYGRAVGEAERLVKAGCTPDELRQIAEWLLGDPFWAHKGITVKTIYDQRDNWRAARTAPFGSLRALDRGQGGFDPLRKMPEDEHAEYMRKLEKAMAEQDAMMRGVG